MCQGNRSSALVISLIAAFVFGLIIAVFGKSAAACQLHPENVDNSQIAITPCKEQVDIFGCYAGTELEPAFIEAGAHGPEAAS
jgi:hypothetical protein